MEETRATDPFLSIIVNLIKIAKYIDGFKFQLRLRQGNHPQPKYISRFSDNNENLIVYIIIRLRIGHKQ